MISIGSWLVSKSKVMKLKPKIISALVLALLSNSALALEPFVIKDIRVEGLQRTEAGTVLN
jgi:outer membrane protein insertion porin family